MMIEAWQALTGIFASTVIVAGGAVAVVKHLLRADFVSRAQHDALERQVNSVKEQIRALPTEKAMVDLARRMGSVEAGVAVANKAIEGVEAGLKRVEHTGSLMLQRLLENDK